MKKLLALLLLTPLTLTAAPASNVTTFKIVYNATNVDGTPAVVGGAYVYCGGAQVATMAFPVDLAPIPPNLMADGVTIQCVATQYNDLGVEGVAGTPITLVNSLGKYLLASIPAAPGLSAQ